jgi:hypothetical protein
MKERYMPDFLAAERSEWLSKNTPKLAALKAGQIKVMDLDDEEVFASSVRDVNGTVHPDGWRIVPKKLHSEMVAECSRRFMKSMQRWGLEAMRVLVEIMVDPNQPAAVRRACANDILERTFGKAPDKVELTITEKPYVEAMQRVAGLFGDSAAPPIEPTAAQRDAGERVR